MTSVRMATSTHAFLLTLGGGHHLFGTALEDALYTTHAEWARGYLIKLCCAAGMVVEEYEQLTNDEMLEYFGRSCACGAKST